MSDSETFAYSESWFSELQDQVFHIRNAPEWSTQNRSENITVVEEPLSMVKTKDEPQILNGVDLEKLLMSKFLIKCGKCENMIDEISFQFHICSANVENNLIIPQPYSTFENVEQLPSSECEFIHSTSILRYSDLTTTQISSTYDSTTSFQNNGDPQMYDENVEIDELQNNTIALIPISDGDSINNGTNALKKSKKQKGQFECTVCHRLLKFDTGFIRHMKKHLMHLIQLNQTPTSSTKRVFIKCFVCGIIFLEPYTALQHMCTNITTNREQYDNSALPFLKIKKNEWTFCAPTEQEATLPVQLILVSLKSIIRCEFCELEFCDVSSLLQHYGEHVAERPFECFTCGIFVRTAEEITEHWETKCAKIRGDKKMPQAEVERYFICNVCKIKLPNIKKLHEHRHAAKHFLPRQNKTLDVLQIPCEYCEMVFQVEEDLVSHFNKEHFKKPHTNDTSEYYWDKSKNFLCDLCGKAYFQLGHLQQHLRFHRGEKPYACKEPGCTRKFTVSTDLNDHIRKCHTGERPYQCEECGKSFLTGSVYYQHRLIHRDDRRHKCELCGKQFLRKNTLQYHQLTHTGEKPHHCTFCKRVYRRRGDAIRHMRERHSHTSQTI